MISIFVIYRTSRDLAPPSGRHYGVTNGSMSKVSTPFSQSEIWEYARCDLIVYKSKYLTNNHSSAHMCVMGCRLYTNCQRWQSGPLCIRFKQFSSWNFFLRLAELHKKVEIDNKFNNDETEGTYGCDKLAMFSSYACVCVEHIEQCFVGGEHALTGIKEPQAQPPLKVQCRIGKPVL